MIGVRGEGVGEGDVEKWGEEEGEGMMNATGTVGRNGLGTETALIATFESLSWNRTPSLSH